MQEGREINTRKRAGYGTVSPASQTEKPKQIAQPSFWSQIGSALGIGSEPTNIIAEIRGYTPVSDGQKK